MQISLAQALKEKNRIAGEINLLWNAVQKQNSCYEGHKRSIDVNATIERINLYTEKLIELKAKIGKANSGNLENMYALEECKNQIKKYESINADEYIPLFDDDYGELNKKKTCILSASDIFETRTRLQYKCNGLQDEIDAYNVVHKIEFETPLK